MTTWSPSTFFFLLVDWNSLWIGTATLGPDLALWFQKKAYGETGHRLSCDPHWLSVVSELNLSRSSDYVKKATWINFKFVLIPPQTCVSEFQCP